MNLAPYSKRLVVGLTTLVMTIIMAVACVPAATSVGVVGTDVGDQSPAFAMQLADGSQVTSQELEDQDQPALLFYFATW